MSINNGKKIMRIAMIGVSPADQVTFKGYLRVLLRLDVELEWATSVNGTIDLFVINDEFRNSSSVVGAIERHPQSALLYIGKTTSEGKLIGNLLTLPLKQIRLLHEWLIANVDVLKESPVPSVPAYEPANKPQIKQAVIQPSVVASDKHEQTAKTIDTSFNDVIDLVVMLNKRHSSLCELMQDGEVIAIIDPSKQLLWQQSTTKPKASTSWRLRLVQGVSFDPKHAVDMNQWLWNVMWEHAGNLVRLVNNTSTYQIRAWAKPSPASRREILRIMTAMEKQPTTINQIAGHAGVPVSVAQKAVASLLVAGYLQDSNYRNIKVYTLDSTTAKPEAIAPVVQETKPAEAPAPEQQEKLGFLARLRRKLGL